MADKMVRISGRGKDGLAKAVSSNNSGNLIVASKPSFDYVPIETPVIALRGSVLYGASGAKLYKSVDNGETWSTSIWTIPDSATITIGHITQSGALLVFGNNGKLYRSTDDVNFTVVQADISSPLLHRGIDSNGLSVIFGEYTVDAGTPIRLMKSSDDGVTWSTSMSLGVSGDNNINHFHTCQYIAQLSMWLATVGDGTTNWYASYNNGSTWTTMYSGPSPKMRTLGVMTRKSDELVWASDASVGNFGVFKCARNTIMNSLSKSIDTLLTLPAASYGLCGEGNTLIVTTMSHPTSKCKAAYVYVSNDGGNTWGLEYSVNVSPSQLYSGIVNIIGPDEKGNYYFSVRYGIGMEPTKTIKMVPKLENNFTLVSEVGTKIASVGKNIVVRTYTVSNLAKSGYFQLPNSPDPDCIETLLQITTRIPGVSGATTGTHELSITYGVTNPSGSALILTAPYNTLLGLHSNSISAGVTTKSESGTFQQYLDGLNAGRYKTVYGVPLVVGYENKTDADRQDTITFIVVVMQERINITS